MGTLKISKKNTSNSEQALVKAFNRTYDQTLQKGQSFLILTEAKTNWGIADILSIHYDKSKLCSRCKEANISQPEFSNLAAHAMAFLSGKGNVAVSELGNHLRTRNGNLSQVIDILVGRGLAYAYKNGTVRARTKANTFAIKDILAFEAKISNWRRAVLQAERHLWFTNSSFIIVPNVTRPTIDKIRHECTSRGVGLIAQTGTTSFKLVSEPIKKRRLDSFFSWKLNEILIDRSIGNGQSRNFESPY